MYRSYGVHVCVNAYTFSSVYTRDEISASLERVIRYSVLVFGTQSSRVQTRPEAVRIFQGEKNHQQAFLRKGSKDVCPMS
jgi:hypothetical protein